MRDKPLYNNSLLDRHFAIKEMKDRINKQLDEVAKREDNWDGKGSLKPKSAAVSNARNILSDFVDVSQGLAIIEAERTEKGVSEVCSEIEDVFNKEGD